jgi:alpha-tubulin suppressor-like RCC1 family protein
LNGVIAVAASYLHSLALKQDGTVVAWGGNYLGQCDVPAGLSNVTAVSAGTDHSVALKQDGGIVVWANNYHGQLNLPSELR